MGIINDEKNQVEFYLSRRYIKLCFYITIGILAFIAVCNCILVQATSNEENTWVEYVFMYGSLFIALFPLIVSFVNDTKMGYYTSFLLNLAFLIFLPLAEGKIWYIVFLIAIPGVRIARGIMDFVHHKYREKPEKEIDDPYYDKYPYNEMETADSDHDSDSDGDGDDDMSGEGDIDLED